jgi:purine-binding chemotaxis protein CheW
VIFAYLDHIKRAALNPRWQTRRLACGASRDHGWPGYQVARRGLGLGNCTPHEVQDRGAAILFRARERLCAVPVTQVREIMRPLPITFLADMPRFVLGLSRIRDTATPVVDAGALLGLESPAATTRFLILRIADRSIALAVEAVTGMHRIVRESLQGLPPLLRDSNGDMVSSIATLDKEFLLVLHTARLIPESVQRALAPQEG